MNLPKSDLILPAILAVFIVACLGATFLFNTVTADPDPADQFAADVTAWANVYDDVQDTATRAAPSATPEETHTPTRPVATSVPNIERQIIYLDREVEVTRIVVRTVVVTATPRPATRTPTATHDYAADFMALKLSNEKRENVGAWGMLIGIGVGAGAFLLFMIVVGVRKLKPSRPTLEETTQTVEHIIEDPLSDIDAGVRFRIYSRWARRPRPSMRQIEREVFGYNGGAAHETVKRCIEHFEKSYTSPPPDQDFDGAGVA